MGTAYMESLPPADCGAVASAYPPEVHELIVEEMARTSRMGFLSATDRDSRRGEDQRALAEWREAAKRRRADLEEVLDAASVDKSLEAYAAFLREVDQQGSRDDSRGSSEDLAKSCTAMRVD